MKKLTIITLGLLCAATLVSAQDAKPKKHATDEQKTVRKEMLDKYDANKDGKLDKEERSKMSKEDKAKWRKAFARKKAAAESSANP